MQEVANNLFRFDLTLKSKRPSLILVHPFYFGFLSEAYQLFSGKLSKGRAYQNNLTQLLQENKENNIILLEQEKHKDFTLDYLTHLTGTKGRYLMNANEHGPKGDILLEPEEYTSLASFLKEQSSEVYFAGGRLRILFPGTERLLRLYPPKKPYKQPLPVFPDTFCGCLGDVKQSLENRGISGKIIEDCCYI